MLCRSNCTFTSRGIRYASGRACVLPAPLPAAFPLFFKFVHERNGRACVLPAPLPATFPLFFQFVHERNLFHKWRVATNQHDR